MRAGSTSSTRCLEQRQTLFPERFNQILGPGKLESRFCLKYFDSTGFFMEHLGLKTLEEKNIGKWLWQGSFPSHPSNPSLSLPIIPIIPYPYHQFASLRVKVPGNIPWIASIGSSWVGETLCDIRVFFTVWKDRMVDGFPLWKTTLKEQQVI